jgi:adenylate cyclase
VTTLSWARFKEQLRTRLHQPWFGGCFGAALTVSLGLLLLRLPEGIDVGKGLRDWSYDLPFVVRPEISHTNFLIIYLNEESCRELKQDTVDFDRSLHARLVRKLKAAGAKMIVFDVVFTDHPNRPISAADRDFAQAMREEGRVVLGADYKVDEHLLSNGISAPLDPLRDACAGWGLAIIHSDPDNEARKVHPGTDRYPSLAWKSAEILGAAVTRNPENRGQERWLNYYSHEPFKGISYYDAIRDGGAPLEFFKNKIIFIGAGDVTGHVGDLREQFRSPWTWLTGHFHLGVEIHALTLCNLLHQDWMWRMPYWLEFFLVLVAGLLSGYGLSLCRPLAATGAALAFALVVTVANYVAFVQSNLWFPWLIVVAAQVPAALAWSCLYYSIRSYLETKLLETSLALYLSPRQVNRILKQPGLLKPGGTQQTVSILFSDIANFSKISERMEPDDLVRLLNDYYEAAIAGVHKTEGTVMNLIGDAIFAIWNAPEGQSDHQERACRAALLLTDQLKHFDATSHHLPMQTRVGLHTGVVCVGNIGSSTHFDYTAVGECVNLASRLEGLNKQLGTNILATREMQRAVERVIVTRLVGHFKFKGFDRMCEVYELISTVETGSASQSWREMFEKALWHFRRQQFDEAAEGLQKTLLLRPGDGPSRYYLARIAELQSRGVPQEWMGEIDLQEK